MPGETSPASTTFCAKSGCRGGESSSGSRLAGRAQHAASTFERARYKLKREEAVPLEWTRHAQGRRLFNRETETAIIGRVAHKDHRALAAAAGCGGLRQAHDVRARCQCRGRGNRSRRPRAPEAKRSDRCRTRCPRDGRCLQPACRLSLRRRGRRPAAAHLAGAANFSASGACRRPRRAAPRAPRHREVVLF